MSETEKVIVYSFRWPAKQINPFQIEIEIPVGATGIACINPGFVEAFKLTDDEVDKAEYQVLKTVAILPDGIDPATLYPDGKHYKSDVYKARDDDKWVAEVVSAKVK